MRDVGVFEASHHVFFLYYITRISNTENNDVTVFTTPDKYERIEPLFADEELDEYRWIIKQEDEHIDEFFNRVERICSTEIDFLWVNTAYGHNRIAPNFVAFDPACPSLCCPYNLNDWTYNPLPDVAYDLLSWSTPLLLRYLPESIAPPIFQQLRYLMHPCILRNHDAVNIEYPPMRKFVSENAGWEQSVHSLTPVLYEADKLPAVSQSDALRIGIPGRISDYVRDYETVFDALEPIFAQHGDDLILDLIGQPMEKYEDIMDTVDAFQNQGYQVDYRTEWLPFDAFAEAIRRCDILLNPLHVRRRLKHPFRADMITGRTNGTGVIFDAIRYARPLILPSTFPRDPMLEPFTRTYDSETDLRRLVTDLLESDTELHQLQESMNNTALEYDLSSQQPRFDSIVDEILNER